MSTEEGKAEGVGKRTAKGLGKDSQWYVVLAAFFTEAVNEHMGLGITVEQIVTVGGAMLVGATRLRRYLGE